MGAGASAGLPASVTREQARRYADEHAPGAWAACDLDSRWPDAGDISRDEFLALFKFKAALFYEELVCVLLSPLILCFSLPSCARAVLDFVRENTVDVDGLGSVLGQSLFDFSQYGNEEYAAGETGARAHATKDGKMEKSFLNFKIQHPNWDCGERDPVGHRQEQTPMMMKRPCTKDVARKTRVSVAERGERSTPW